MQTSPGSILSEGEKLKTFRRVVVSAGELLNPKPRLNVWQWAERYRYVARGVSAKTLEGPRLYRSSDAPHQRGPQESATDPGVQVTVLIMASQIGGKTEIFNNILGYHMHWQPRNSILMYPTIPAAEKYSKKKFTPMAEESPCLSGILRPARSRDSGNTILVKDFHGGSVYFVGANSPPSLRAASGAVLLGDEVDSYEASAGSEGDPVELLFKRGESFPNCVKMLASTPTIKGVSRIWDWWESSDQQFWHVPCPRCGTYQILAWQQVQWPEGCPEGAALVCSSCAAVLNDKQRLEMYHNGQWRATAPFRGVRGYHLNGIYAPWPAQKGFNGRLHQMAEEHLRAHKKGEFAVQVWVNTFLCELFERTVGKIDHHKVAERAEKYGPETLPEGVVVVLCAVDVQKGFIQCETIGLGLDEETWGIEVRKIEGDTEQDDVWADLADHLAKKYRRVDGVELPVTATAIDMRHKPHKVRLFVQRSGIPRVFPVYGVKTTQSPVLVTTRFNKHYRLRTYAIATKIAKDSIYARLRLTDKGPRYMHFPRGHGYTTDFFAQLTAEVLVQKKVRGVMVENYEKVRERNEALDIRVYFLATIDILKPAVGIIAKHLTAGRAAASEQKEYVLKPEVKPAATGAAPPKPAGPRPRVKITVGGF